jgi:hypothetical protein
VKVGDRADLQRGNKFVVQEYFMDKEGNPVESQTFDARQMSYALFVSPEHYLNGRHRNVPYSHQPRAKAGKILGGGLLRVSEEGVVGLTRYSVDFGVEPLEARQALQQLLIPELRIALNDPSLRASESVTTDAIRIHDHWLRFRQALEALRAICEKEKRLDWYEVKTKSYNNSYAK